jgi:hypothetical protein
MKYKVIWAQELYSLVEQVNVWIEKGWTPQGGLVVLTTPKLCYQTMIKQE